VIKVEGNYNLVYPAAFLEKSEGKLASREQSGLDLYAPYNRLNGDVTRYIELLGDGKEACSRGQKGFTVLSIKKLTGSSGPNRNTGRREEESFRLSCVDFSRASVTGNGWWSVLLINYDTEENCEEAKAKIQELRPDCPSATLFEIHEFAKTIKEPTEFSFAIQGSKSSLKIMKPESIVKVMDEMFAQQISATKVLEWQKKNLPYRFLPKQNLMLYASSSSPDADKALRPLWANYKQENQNSKSIKRSQSTQFRGTEDTLD